MTNDQKQNIKEYQKRYREARKLNNEKLIKYLMLL